MLPSTVLLSLVAAASAQNYSFPKGFDPEQIELGTRSSWCTAERSTCPRICGGTADENTCEPEKLDFSCKCEDGAADVESYMQTIPYFVCQANFGRCIDSHPNDADGQDQCKKDNQCGTKNATEEASSSTSSSSSASSTSTPSSSSSSMPSSVDSVASGSSNSPSSTANAAALVQEHSTGLLAMGLFVAARLVL